VQKKLTASDAAANDSFGQFAAISGDAVVVGASGVDYGDYTYAGSAYVFTRTGGDPYTVSDQAIRWAVLYK
jgi:hypothetical protein